MVRVHAGPLDLLPKIYFGAVAQLGEHLICIQKVAGSIPVSSTTLFFENWELMSIHKCESSSAKNAEGGNFIL